jgi:hypothetical protein
MKSLSLKLWQLDVPPARLAIADEEAAESSVSAAAAMWEALAAAMLLADLLLAESFFVFFLPDFNGRDDWLGLDSDWAVSGVAVAGRAVDCPVLRGDRRSTLPLCVAAYVRPTEAASRFLAALRGLNQKRLIKIRYLKRRAADLTHGTV